MLYRTHVIGCRGFCFFTGYSLDGNILATLTVNNAANCVIKCLQHPECQSTNFHVSANPEHVCELNSKTDNDVTLTAKSDVIYYGPTQANQVTI